MDKKQKKVVILGSTGMLGIGASEPFLKDDNYITYLSYRNEEQKYGINNFYFNASFSDLSLIPQCDYIINCLGVIKPFMHENMVNSIYINSIFPRKLAAYCRDNDTRLINISTDCCFSGKKGKYVETDLHDCLDEYGKTKSLGEDTKNSMVLRTSIIGDERHKYASFLSWIRNQEGKEVNGFTNHKWNGITTEYYGIICKKIIEKNLYKNGLYHIFSSTDLTKCDILELFNKIYDLKMKINPTEDKESIDRTLRTNYGLCESLNIPSFEAMVKDWQREQAQQL